MRRYSCPILLYSCLDMENMFLLFVKVPVDDDDLSVVLGSSVENLDKAVHVIEESKQDEKVMVRFYKCYLFFTLIFSFYFDAI